MAERELIQTKYLLKKGGLYWSDARGRWDVRAHAFDWGSRAAAERARDKDDGAKIAIVKVYRGQPKRFVIKWLGYFGPTQPPFFYYGEADPWTTDIRAAKRFATREEAVNTTPFWFTQNLAEVVEVKP